MRGWAVGEVDPERFEKSEEGAGWGLWRQLKERQPRRATLSKAVARMVMLTARIA